MSEGGLLFPNWGLVVDEKERERILRGNEEILYSTGKDLQKKVRPFLFSMNHHPPRNQLSVNWISSLCHHQNSLHIPSSTHLPPSIHSTTTYQHKTSIKSPFDFHCSSFSSDPRRLQPPLSHLHATHRRPPTFFHFISS